MIAAGLFGFKKTVVSESVAAQLHVSRSAGALVLWFGGMVGLVAVLYCNVTPYTFHSFFSPPTPPCPALPLQLVYTYDQMGVTRHLRPLDLPVECGGRLEYDHHQWLLHKLVRGGVLPSNVHQGVGF